MVTMAKNKYGQYYDDDPYYDRRKYDSYSGYSRREEERRWEKERLMEQERQRMLQMQQQQLYTVPVTTYGSNTFTGTFTDLQLNTGGVTTTIPLNLRGGGELPAALEGQKESPLQWLDRRVNEICKVGALQ